MRVVPFAVLAIVLVSCREVLPPDTQAVPVEGYELRGIVTSSNGVPLPGVEVYLSYNAVLAQTTPTDTQQVIIDSLTQVLDVTVVSTDLRPVKVLYHGFPASTGIVPRYTWDENDGAGNPVPGGKYLIRYSIDSRIIKYSPVIVTDHLIATTDIYGRFAITPDQLPVDEVFDEYYMNNYFSAAYRILPVIDLYFYRQGQHSAYPSISLTLNHVTTGVFVL